MKCNSDPIFATTTPADYPISSAFGYTTNGQNFPGLLGLTFQPSSTIAGYSITNQTSLLAVSFPNLIVVPAGSLASFTGNTQMTSVAFAVLTGSLVTLSIQNNASLTSISLPVLATSAGLNFSTNAVLPSISLPGLTTLTATFNASSNPLLTSISAPLLLSASSFTANMNTLLNTVSLPSLVTLSGSLSLTADPALSSLILTNYVPTNGRVHTITGAALTDTSVNLLLARGVANAAYVSGTINTSGGTSSAPTGQGIIDKATLIARGVTVLTN